MTTATTHIDVDISGLALQMFAERGLYWPAQRTLFIADTHFGKDATFRRFGLAVPAGSTDSTLAAIDRMIGASGTSRVIILGDLFHAKSSLSSPICKSLDLFFERHSDVEFALIRGNHDRRVGRLPTTWPIAVREPGETVENVVLAHEPGTVPESAAVMLCGHIHPAVNIGSRTERLGKIACFWLSKRCLVLPAIGDFTGTYAIRPAADDRVWLVVDDQVISHRI